MSNRVFFLSQLIWLTGEIDRACCKKRNVKQDSVVFGGLIDMYSLTRGLITR